MTGFDPAGEGELEPVSIVTRASRSGTDLPIASLEPPASDDPCFPDILPILELVSATAMVGDKVLDLRLELIRRPAVDDLPTLRCGAELFRMPIVGQLVRSRLGWFDGS